MAAFLGSSSGLTPQRLRARRYERLSRDLYVLRDAERDLVVQLRAVQLALPDAIGCGPTAGQLLGLPVRAAPELHVARPMGSGRSERPGLVTHRWSVDPDEVMEVQGARVTDGPRSFVDLAATLSRLQLIGVGDAVARRWGTDALSAAVRRRARRPGLVRARDVLALLDPGAESPAESRLRIRLHEAGFNRMRHGVIVRDGAGGWLAAPDLADEAARVAVQHDGLVHLLGDPERRRKDIARDEVTRAAGWEVVVSTAIDDRRPEQLIDRVEAAYLRAARWAGPQVLPVHLRGRAPRR